MKLDCPICSTTIEVGEDLVGHKGRCTSCGTKFVIPADRDEEIEILQRGEPPEKPAAPERANRVKRGAKPALKIPDTKSGARRRVPIRAARGRAGSPIGMIAAACACVAVAVGLVLVRGRGDAPAKPGGGATRAPVPPAPAGAPAPGPGLATEAPAPQPAPPALAAETAANAPPPVEAPQPDARPAAEPAPPSLSEDKKARALAFLKSTQESKFRGAFAAFRNLGDREKATFLDLLARAAEHHATNIGNLAFDLSIADNAVTEFKDAFDAWTGARDSARRMVQTNWKDKEPGDYKRRHAEMDGAFQSAVDAYASAMRAAERARRFEPAGLREHAAALAEIRAEIAWWQGREAPRPTSLREEISSAGGAEGYLRALESIEVAQGLAEEFAAVQEHNASSTWASGAYKSFAASLNERRAALGLTPLRLDKKLCDACAAHSADMAANGYFSHTGLKPETKTFGARAKRAGFDGSASGECIFMGNPSPAAAHQAWWYSDGHRLIMYASGPNTLGLGLSGKHWTLNTGKKRW